MNDTSIRRVLVHPAVPAYVAFATCAGAAGAYLTGRPAPILVWVLLGVTAGYSISGSV